MINPDMVLCFSLFVKLFGLIIIGALVVCLDGATIENRIIHSKRMAILGASSSITNCEEGVKNADGHKDLSYDESMRTFLRINRDEVKACLELGIEKGKAKNCITGLKTMAMCNGDTKFKLRFLQKIPCINCHSVMNIKPGCKDAWTRFLSEKSVLNPDAGQTYGFFGCDIEYINKDYTGVCLYCVK